MTTFLSCKGTLGYTLDLSLSYQESGTIRTQEITLQPNVIYNISIADNNYGLITYQCHVIGATFTIMDESNTINNYYKKPALDTLRIDFSGNKESGIRDINIGDIRSIQAYTTDGVEEIERTIQTFK